MDTFALLSKKQVGKLYLTTCIWFRCLRTSPKSALAASDTRETIKDKLGFKRAICFEEGMKELIEWSYKESSVDKFEQAYEELKEKGLI